MANWYIRLRRNRARATQSGAARARRAAARSSIQRSRKASSLQNSAGSVSFFSASRRTSPPVGQPCGKCQLATDVDFFHPAAHLFLVADPAMHQSGVSGFVHDDGGAQFGRGPIVEDEAAVELAGPQRLCPSAARSHKHPDPHAVDITQYAAIASRVMQLDDPESFLDPPED